MIEIVKVESKDVLDSLYAGKVVYVLEDEKYEKHKRAKEKTNEFHRIYLRKLDVMRIEEIRKLLNDGSYFCTIERR